MRSADAASPPSVPRLFAGRRRNPRSRSGATSTTCGNDDGTVGVQVDLPPVDLPSSVFGQRFPGVDTCPRPTRAALPGRCGSRPTSRRTTSGTHRLGRTPSTAGFRGREQLVLRGIRRRVPATDRGGDEHRAGPASTGCRCETRRTDIKRVLPPVQPGDQHGRAVSAIPQPGGAIIVDTERTGAAPWTRVAIDDGRPESANVVEGGRRVLVTSETATHVVDTAHARGEDAGHLWDAQEVVLASDGPGPRSRRSCAGGSRDRPASRRRSRSTRPRRACGGSAARRPAGTAGSRRSPPHRTRSPRRRCPSRGFWRGRSTRAIPVPPRRQRPTATGTRSTGGIVPLAIDANGVVVVGGRSL